MVSNAGPKLAIIQCADAGPLESLVQMLNHVGYACTIPNAELRGQLTHVFGGRGLVLAPSDLTRSMGYDTVSVPEVGPEYMRKCDLYVDVKAHQVYDKVVAHWPNLKGKVLYYRINGGQPEHVVNARGDHGDEVNPPCPVLTPNQWYSFNSLLDESNKFSDSLSGPKLIELQAKSYVCWPPFVRWNEYLAKHSRPWSVGREDSYGPPVCLVHNFKGWGYGPLEDTCRKMGVRIYGQGSPDGLIPHKDIPRLLSRAICMIHLKCSDAPGYALYEAAAAACPILCTGRLIWRCKMGDFFIPGKTCLTFDNNETHDGLTPEQVIQETDNIWMYLEMLKNPELNRKVGLAGHNRLEEIMWSPERESDVKSLADFMAQHFG